VIGEESHVALLERVAGAPISWGVCEAPEWGLQLPPERVLREMGEMGLRATELGPEGFLPGEPAELARVLGRHGLRVAGAFVPVVLHDERRLARELAHAAEVADLIAASGRDSVLVVAAVREGDDDGSIELDRRQWSALLRALEAVLELGAERKIRVALHPHHGTVIERAHHVERLLDSSRVPLCIDTGHLYLGGADPAAVARAAGERVTHVHLKDVRADLANDVHSGRIDYREAVGRGLYRPIGLGDVDVTDTVRVLEQGGYRGWYVLEQDVILDAEPKRGAGPKLDVQESLSFFRGLKLE
jgi:inosose dehydratase